MATVVVTEPVTSGRVLLKTTLGEILIELWPREAPRACRNFIQLCLEGYYDGCDFYRIIPGYIAQTGAGRGGGECIYDEGTFGLELTQRLKFTRRGLVAMASSAGQNMSQFFFTLDAAPDLNGEHTIFATVVGDTLYNVLKLAEVEIGPDDRPVFPPRIVSATVEDNPFPEIVPRITPEERKEQRRARKQSRAEAQQRKQGARRKAVKNKSLLSFGDDEEAVLAPKRIESVHDVVRGDARLVRDAPGGGTAPRETHTPDAAAESDGARVPSEHSPSPSPAPPTLKRKREAGRPPSPPEESVALKQQRLKEEIAEMMHRPKPKEAAPKARAKSLLEQEREKYARKGAVVSKSSGNKMGKKAAADDDMWGALQAFRTKVESGPSAAAESADDSDPDQDASGAWLSHQLVFRKDATLDRHSIDEYATIDPRDKASDDTSLHDILLEKQALQQRQRRAPVATASRDRNWKTDKVASRELH